MADNNNNNNNNNNRTMDYECNVDTAPLLELQNALEATKEVIRGHMGFCERKVRNGKRKLRENNQRTPFNEYTYNNEIAARNFHMAMGHLDNAIAEITHTIQSVEEGNEEKDQYRHRVACTMLKEDLEFMGEDVDELDIENNTATASATITNPNILGRRM